MKYCIRGSLFVLATLALASCTDESNQDIAMAKTTPDASSTSVVEGPCAPIQSAQPVPARTEAYVGAPAISQRTVYVDDLFNQFASQCGGCHVDVGLGGFQTSRATFSGVVNQDWVDSMGYNNPNTVMPPPSVGGQLWKDRPADDPVNELQSLMQAWINSGRPYDVFQVPISASDATGPYALDPDLARALTNIGSCIPDKSLFATEKKSMADMDQKFAAMTFTAPGTGTRQQQIGLPQLLSDTDLTTFDSRELAKFGVISYAPAYPQWVDPDSRSMRHVRVPLGQPITFDKTNQMFTIPGGTRFYRTLMQRVVDAAGTEHWRKVETQLIVSWPNLGGGVDAAAVQALFGTYAWNESETQATLVTDPLRDGTPFRDRIVTYVSDEGRAAATIASNPKNISIALRQAHAARSYAITGSRRCMQCHLGSVSKSFVNGLQPMQLVRRNAGEGGVLIEDAPGSDELSQLDRLISYGVISGISSAQDVVLMENSEGTRKPRSDAELTAQAYMFGNCAHCHNPVGDPSLENPSLQTVAGLPSGLNFQPSTTGGIFQFSLEAYSPRITRGQNVPVPYITPSLLDIDHPNGYDGDPFWMPKCDPNTLLCIYAPWRSLIYRGVDTPFTYSDDLALIPHMPMNTQSFDLRAPRIIGDWMVSIPGVLKNPNVVEYVVRTNSLQSPEFDSSPQPYKEVKSGTGFKTAVAAATDRLHRYRVYPSVPVDNWVYPSNENANPVEPPMPSRYQLNIDNYDIFDPRVLGDPKDYPVPIDSPTGIMQNGAVVMPRDNVPDHAHWVVLDQTKIPGAWAPRRPDWYTELVSGDPSMTTSERTVVDELQSATLTSELKQFAVSPMPMGLWQRQTSCDFSGVSTVAEHSNDTPTWLQQAIAQKQVSATDPVYLLAPGEFVHNLICSNCHGVNANSAGREATLLSEMTGGNANVTDLIHGIMVPSNRSAVFQSAPHTNNVTMDDWAARYFAWMAMGGTKQKIPSSILAIIGNTKVAGTPRLRTQPPVDANMLSTAQDLCADVLPFGLQAGYLGINPDNNAVFNFEAGLFASNTSLIYTNGDAMMWGQICTVNNPPPVRALRALNWLADVNAVKFGLFAGDYYDSTLYPAGASVVNQRGEVVSLSNDRSGIPSNIYFPLCIRKPSDSNTLQLADAWRAAHLAPLPGHLSSECGAAPSAACTRYPYCPTTDKDGKRYIGEGPDATVSAQWTNDQLVRWTIRGAINAGFMAFWYLDQLQDEDVGPTPSYDQCSQLTQ